MYGPGVEKVFEELKKSFPTKYQDFSSDYLNRKKAVRKFNQRN